MNGNGTGRQQGSDREPASACSLGYTEQFWIDRLLEGAPFHEHGRLDEHLRSCASCRLTVEQWRELLPTGGLPGRRRPPESAAAGSPPASEARYGQEAGSGAPIGEPPLPREAIRRKLRRRVLAIGRRRAAAGSRRKRLLGAAAAVVVLLIAVGGLYRMVSDPADQRSRFVEEHEPMAAAFISDPATASYRVHPSSRDLGEGFVWFNDDSEEALVMLEGVLPSKGHDLQVWAVKRGGRSNLGLLRYEENNRAHLYVRGGALSEADNIALTVEPSGGSVMPTSPDAFIFRLQRK